MELNRDHSSAEKRDSASWIHFARRCDLPEIVQLEALIFQNTTFVETGNLFLPETIRKYYDHCPNAFRVVSEKRHIVGYSVVFPLNNCGVDELENTATNSVLSMQMSGLHTSFDEQLQAIFLEVIATISEASILSRFLLLRDLVQILRKYRVPIYTCPITSIGLKLISDYNFVPVQGSGLDHLYRSKDLFKKD